MLYIYIHTGSSILEGSKYRMTEFYYNVILRLYGIDRATLLATDTDSLILHISGVNDIYADLALHAEHFDSSNYSPDNPAYSEQNKMVIGKFKNEIPNCIVTEFCGLCSKCYSLKLDDGKHKNTCKGVSREYLKRQIRHEHYKAILFSNDGSVDDSDKNQQFENSEQLINESTRATFKSIGSIKHQLQTITVEKKCLCKFDNKCYIESCNSFKTLPFRH